MVNLTVGVTRSNKQLMLNLYLKRQAFHQLHCNVKTGLVLLLVIIKYHF